MRRSKKAAIEAARRLLAENARRFSEDVTIEAEVVSELEWTPIAVDGRRDSEDAVEMNSA